MLYTNQCFLAEAATSILMHTKVVNFAIVMEIGWDNVGTYFSTAVPTYKKFDIVVYAMPLTLKTSLHQHEPKLFFLYNRNKQYLE